MKVLPVIRTPNQIKRLSGLSLLLLLLCTMTGCRGWEAVATVPNEIEAIEIFSLLDEFSVEAHKEEITEDGNRHWRVLVAASDVAQANRILRDYGLPRPGKAGREKARQDGLFPSPEDVKQQHLNELETEIERQLWLLPGVIRAKVIVSPAGGDILEFDPAQATASVVIVSREKEPYFTDAQVRELVAGSVARLKPENVRVTIATELPRVNQESRSDMHSSNVPQTATGLIALLGLSLLGLIVFNLVWQRRRAAMLSESQKQLSDESDSSDNRLRQARQKEAAGTADGHKTGLQSARAAAGGLANGRQQIADER